MIYLQKILTKLYFQTPIQNKILNRYRELINSDKNTYSYNESIQLKRLNHILNHAFKFVPFYKKHWKGLKYIENNTIVLNSINQLYDFPVLTKELIKKNSKDLLAANYKNRKPFLNTSGGSTGAPLSLVQDEEYQINNLASFYLSRSWKGIDFYDKTIYLWGAERDTFIGKKPYIEYLKDYILNTNRLNTFILNPKTILKYIDIINKSNAKLIIAYVQSIHEIARYAKKNNIYIKKQNAIHCAAGTLYDFMKKEIEEVFQCRAYNHYGSREVGAIASECSANDGLHILMHHNIVQPLNFNHKEKETNIIVTNLSNYSMPLIRYDIGDLGVFVEEKNKCKCGVTYPKIKKVVGRTTDFFQNKKGDKIDGEYFTHLLYFLPEVNRFQIVQEDFMNIIIKIQGVKGCISHEKTLDIIQKVRLVMGDDCIVNFSYVNEIEKTKTGKFLYTYSKLNS
tara:strand:- start:717 stop:2072 length:1356 start_codon:yes stop_codon:yes gene_type:complete